MRACIIYEFIVLLSSVYTLIYDKIAASSIVCLLIIQYNRERACLPLIVTCPQMVVVILDEFQLECCHSAKLHSRLACLYPCLVNNLNKLLVLLAYNME
ncbi:hypothetical protein BDF22DRAFT_701500 [Syncephalis plumigaleata]|nr:hypothetical protein BDF22DRAFT_701500 [Syncephalis plumigaleata]